MEDTGDLNSQLEDRGTGTSGENETLFVRPSELKVLPEELSDRGSQRIAGELQYKLNLWFDKVKKAKEGALLIGKYLKVKSLNAMGAVSSLPGVQYAIDMIDDVVPFTATALSTVNPQDLKGLAFVAAPVLTQAMGAYMKNRGEIS